MTPTTSSASTRTSGPTSLCDDLLKPGTDAQIQPQSVSGLLQTPQADDQNNTKHRVRMKGKTRCMSTVRLCPRRFHTSRCRYPIESVQNGQWHYTREMSLWAFDE